MRLFYFFCYICFLPVFASGQDTIRFIIPEDTRKSIEYDAGIGRNLKDAIDDFDGSRKTFFFQFVRVNPTDSVTIQIGEDRECSFPLIHNQRAPVYKIYSPSSIDYDIISPNNTIVCSEIVSGALSNITITRWPHKQKISSEEDILPQNIPPVSFLDSKTVEMMLSPWKQDTEKLNKNVFKIDLLNPYFLKPKLIIGNILNFKISNYNPYRDSVRIRVAFVDHHPNAETEFKALVETQFKGAESTPDEEANESNTIDSGSRGNNGIFLPNSIKAINAVIKGFHRDMTTMYERLFTQKTLNPDSLEVGILRIDRAIATNFGLPSGSVITATTIQARAMELIKELEADEKTALEQMIKEGVAEYGKIKDYNRLAFFPVQIDNKDYSEITYNVKHKDKWSNDLTIKTNNRWGSGFGYSLGVMGTGLRDYTYGLKQVPPETGSTQVDSVYLDSIYQTDNGKYNLGPLVLGHYYTRLPGGVAIAISTGWGVNGQLDNHFFLGGSLMLGRKNDLVVSTGWNWAKVNRLDGRYQVGDRLPVVKGMTNSVTTQKIWANGFFFSISKQM